ncbi:MAG: phosphoglycolate phosphatase [Rudaea sp.]|uniref:phosphoglycolate phosphatase n=1 Tax=unclassified Rudaea TaxID=2627037 RepID=UPI0010F86322|nr:MULTISPECIES: phosphoglycolate phosphatase [unclassified Rudaea]MBN8888609.1 phosphoglycolate phosphatase [Rudaea sp.]
MSAKIQAVFFDLDGTLIDSAPDLVDAMRRLRAELGEPAIALDQVGAVVSKGGRAMLRAGFPGVDEARLESLMPRYLDLYAEQIAAYTRTFDGIDGVLARFEASALPWGIVTNKPEYLARAVVAELGLDKRSAALVGGDTLPVRKPDPAPLLHAAQLAGVDAARSVYVGDDARDIEAGRAAGMRTVAAAWGYLDGEDPHAWGADIVIAKPHDLLPALGFD